MQDKELDNLLKESVENEKVRDISNVWNDIKEEVLSQKKQQYVFWKRWVPIVLTSVMVIVCVILSPLLINEPSVPENPQEEIFYSDALGATGVTLIEALETLNQLNESCITTQKYEITDTMIFLSEENKVKGAKFTIYSEDPIFVYAEIDLYTKDVDANIKIEEDYDSTCTVKSASVHYKFKQELDGLYEYDIYIVHNDIQYIIYYMGLSNDLTEFLNYFID